MEQQDRLTDLFLRAIELPPDLRSTFLDRECGSNHRLRADLEGMLAADATPQHAFDAPLQLRPELPFEKVGNYRVLRVLGEGGMGTVYEAEQEQPKRRVALKLMRSDLRSESAIKRFRRESEVLARLHHAGIAQIFEAGEITSAQGVKPWYAMEHVEGVPLDRYLADRKPDLQTRVALIAEICDAVDHAHGRGVVHRDLKPSNILIDAAGRAHVLDFGIARVLDLERSESQLTESGQVIGTLDYMSPEQMTGDSRRIDPRTDVYAIGVIAFESVLGRMPYALHNRTLAERARAIAEDDPEFLEARIPRDLETILRKALAKESERRYPAAGALAADLRRFLHDEPIEARRASTIYRMTKFARRNRGLVTGVLGGFVLMLVGLLFAVAQWRSAMKSTEAKQREYERASAVEKLMLDTIDQADPTRTRGKKLTMHEAFLAAAGRLEKSPPENAATRGVLHHSVGQVFFRLADYANAEKNFAIAYEMQSKGTDGTSTAAANDALTALAEIEGNTKRLDSALEKFQRIHASEIAADPSSPRVATSANNLAWILRNMGKRDEALQYANDAVARLAQLPDRKLSLVRAQCILAGIYIDRRELEAAEGPARAAHEMSLAEFGPDHYATLDAAGTLQIVLDKTGRAAEGIVIARQIVDSFTRSLGPDNERTLGYRANLVASLAQLGDLANAEKEIVDILPRIEGRTDVNPAMRVMLLVNLSHMRAELMNKDGASAAARDLEAAIQSLPAKHGFRETALFKLVAVRNVLGEFDDAKRNGKELREWIVATRGDQDPALAAVDSLIADAEAKRVIDPRTEPNR